MTNVDQDIPEIIVTCDKDIVVNEVDNNQPCLTCGDHCPGYLAHDWRNVCIHCKCVREDHDVYNENFVNVRDRLGWKRDDGPEKTVSKEMTLSEGYTWVPANLSSKKIREYMDQLPNHKVPKVATDGERYRDIQVIKQLPKQDLSDLYCRFLDGEVEKKEFMIFRELRDQVAMGIGLVKECPVDTWARGVEGSHGHWAGQGVPSGHGELGGSHGHWAGQGVPSGHGELRAAMGIGLVKECPVDTVSWGAAMGIGLAKECPVDTWTRGVEGSHGHWAGQGVPSGHGELGGSHGHWAGQGVPSGHGELRAAMGIGLVKECPVDTVS
ncbi:Prickle planar cell polarity protein 3 [Bulinus truncatus]|nr:Prickle planar cell polarity protein 3 [Bulinus truncatus]